MQAIGNGAYPDLQPFNSTIVGFGGFVDEPLSMNAFEGGNVLSDEDFLFDLYVNGAILGPLYTGIGPDKEVLAEQYKKILQGVPIPYNNGLLIRFNYRESYLNGAGEAALPTEFYQKPTTVHLEEWHPLLSSTAYGMFNEGVNSLYTRMAAGDLTTNAVPSPVPANPEPAQSASRDDLDEMSDTLDPSSAVATAGASGAGSEESGDATDLDPMESSV
ncbi:hypothetical protein SARC_13956 [Sphaeroforma arctica JP610]|uniref:Uncharacterized protein n=1 Tax=Sphaeroforma arctica JP610 TaxID=667725 RepID=A0A0L0FAD1_9EUKA|nr:hypothetical protein SARC_13956 [Sphaeroforma arctica JP610]KNC73486.1 hypothetical protein SARC_13956 [Sphaeroforma arctica JP610]|eukprot:XP_014147388.1 hypothetical protein SARC_13956 [Sphaeroforma arctica JP610]